MKTTKVTHVSAGIRHTMLALAILTAGTLAHPAVARAFSARLSRGPAGHQAEPGLGGTAGETLGGQIAQ